MLAAVGDGHRRGRSCSPNFPDDSSPKQLYLERADGTHRRLLLRDSSDDVQPTISPDGRHVVFTRQRAHGSLPDQIFEIRTNGRGLHRSSRRDAR